MASLPLQGVDIQQAAWKRLGSMSFDSNERSNFQARELKSVQVDVVAQLLKVVVHPPHANELNTHQQVGDGKLCPQGVTLSSRAYLAQINSLTNIEAR